jgi:flagellar hook assembly protein FlgD
VLDLEERESDVDVQENTRPAEFSLNQNFPNPFNSSTTISYTLNQSAVANVSIYDLSGRLVRELELDFKYPGSYQQCWDGKDNTGHGVASGIYHYQLILNAPDGNIYRVSRKMVFMK